ncbi:MAG: acylneuraminate cytidylyltransferase family protein [Deltaproteobacteria bacterium]|nr:acylneuraminate cytidylyltransferase family protein [Deltaproteobacteria bacterium]
MTRPTVAAIVPMRHNSERVPGKNFRSFAGRPLYHRIVETLLGCAAIDSVVIDTDSPTILEEAARLFPAVRLLERPAHLRAGETPMNDVLLHTTGVVEADLYLQTHSTNPLLRSATVQQALEVLLATYPSFDSLFGVTRLQTRLWDSLARAVNHNPSILLRTQDLPPIYEENSCLYVFDRDTLLRGHNRIGDRPQLFEVPPNEAWDIDEEIDFEVAEFLFQKRQEG